MFFALARSPPASRHRDGSPRVFARPLLHPHHYLGFQPRFGAFSDTPASRESSLALHAPDRRAPERHKRFQFLESNVSHIGPSGCWRGLAPRLSSLVLFRWFRFLFKPSPSL